MGLLMPSVNIWANDQDEHHRAAVGWRLGQWNANFNTWTEVEDVTTTAKSGQCEVMTDNMRSNILAELLILLLLLEHDHNEASPVTQKATNG